MAVTFSTTYLGGLRTEMVHGPSQTRVLTDAPVDNHGKGEAFSPTDLVASALGSCMFTIMGIVAQRDGIVLDGSTVTVEKHMTSELPRRIARVVVAFSIAPGVPPEHRTKLERAAHTCPVALSLHPDVKQEVSFAWG